MKPEVHVLQFKDFDDNCDDHSEKFLELASEEEVKDCFRRFRAATSNEALRLCRCVVCARELSVEHGEMTRELDDPSIRGLLHPSHRHPAQVLWHGALVLGEEIRSTDDGHSAWICTDCRTVLQKGKVPRLSLANNLWIGDVPYELTALTIPEQLLIARYYPRCYVFKLYPRGGCQLSPDQMQRGMKGNVSLYELNTSDVVRMLEGQIMPNPASTLASVLAITFVGSMSLPKDWLKSTFRVRRRRVYEALIWLKGNNSLYGDISIEEQRLQMIPEDGIPEEVISLIRHEENGEIADREEGCYINPFEKGKETTVDSGDFFFFSDSDVYLKLLTSFNNSFLRKRKRER
jgi:hypothetical protein